MSSNKLIDVNFSVISAIYKKEMRSFFNSPIAYILIVAFLGILSWFYVNNIFLMNTASMRMMFDLIPLIYLFVIPALTMRLIAEERKSGTMELLATKPLRDSEIVLAKFFASWSLIGIALAPTLFYYLTILNLGKIDSGPVVTSYVGILAIAGVYIALGLLASSLTSNQIVAFIVGFLMIFFFFVIDKVLIYLPEQVASILEFIGTEFHYSNITRGIIDTRDIVYFVSVIGFSLYLSVVSLGRRKW